MAPLARFFSSPRGNEGSYDKAKDSAGDEGRGDQLNGVDALHGSGNSACSISLNNALDLTIFPYRRSGFEAMAC
jgi:hypothetical protein